MLATAATAFHTVAPVAGQITANVTPTVAPAVVSPLTKKGTVNDVLSGILRRECFCSLFSALAKSLSETGLRSSHGGRTNQHLIMVPPHASS